MARVCVDGTYFEVDDDGQLTFIPGSVGLQAIVRYTTPGSSTFNKASWPRLRAVRVMCVGGGGGGAGANAPAGQAVARAGGGGGGYSESFIPASALGATTVVTVGAGGLGGVGDNDGQPGTATSFGGVVVANPGDGSLTNMPAGTGLATATGGRAAPPGTGDIATGGGNGYEAFRLGAGSLIGGAGGEGGGGYGHGGRAGGSNLAGGNANGFGGGGGGANSTGDNPLNGGNATGGLVLVEIYY